MSQVLPSFDSGTRTLKARLELDNPGYRLRPEMFVDVEFESELPAALVVPHDAVLDTGMRKVVFVDRGEGYFEPRRVTTGWRRDGRVQILDGLSEGDRIVVSGTFLLDSESRMKPPRLAPASTASSTTWSAGWTSIRRRRGPPAASRSTRPHLLLLLGRLQEAVREEPGAVT